jgi:hypothetical protein
MGEIRNICTILVEKLVRSRHRWKASIKKTANIGYENVEWMKIA